MGSVSGASSTLYSMMQTLVSGSPQVSSTLSSDKVQSGLQNASISDKVELSAQALQLQQANLLFGDSMASASSMSLAFAEIAYGPGTTAAVAGTTSGTASSAGSSATASAAGESTGAGTGSADATGTASGAGSSGSSGSTAADDAAATYAAKAYAAGAT